MLAFAATAALALPPGFTELKLPSPDPTAGEEFGASAASLGTQLVVGAPGGKRVFVVGLDGVVARIIQDPTPTTYDGFGFAVAVLGGNIVVGAPGVDQGQGLFPDTGAAYLFDGTTGALLQTFVVTTAQRSFTQCGSSVGTLGGDVLVLCRDGVYRHDAATGAIVQYYPGGPDSTHAMATIGNDVLISGFGDPTSYLRRFDGMTGAFVQTYADPHPGERNFAGSLAVDGGLVMASRAGSPISFDVFDGTTGAFIQTVQGTGFSGTRVAAAGGVVALFGQQTEFFDVPSFAPLGEWHPEDPRHERSTLNIETIFASSFGLLTDALMPYTGSGTLTVLDRCGNGIYSPAEQCDDGNTVDGDGCSASCRLELCPTVLPGTCHTTAGGISTVMLRKRTTDLGVNQDAFSWTWKGSSSAADFGNPTAGSSYQLCFYDQTTAGPPRLQFDLAIPGGQVCKGAPCWAVTRTLNYKDKDLTPSGILKTVIRPGDGLGKITVKGKGSRLGLPALAMDGTLPFAPGWAVAMVESTSGQCWVATSDQFANTDGRYRGATVP